MIKKLALSLALLAFIFLGFYTLNIGFNKEGTPPPIGKSSFEPVSTITSPKSAYDAIVVGTDPEGIAAAVSSARNGLKTLLVEDRDRDILGGLMTLGWLNMIDLNQDFDPPPDAPKDKLAILNKGIFEEWFQMLEGNSFDVYTAANAFNKLVSAEKNIDVLLHTRELIPLLHEQSEKTTVTGISLTLSNGEHHKVSAPTLIDATQDGDIAVRAGAHFSEGQEELGMFDTYMGATVVFRLKNADQTFWSQVAQRLNNDNNPNTGEYNRAAWGYGEMRNYEPVHKDRVRMRALNIGLQNDETILINALQVFHVDPKDERALAEAQRIAEAELPYVLAYMKSHYPEFGSLELAGVAPEVYIRESRHLYGIYRLNILDVLENRDQWDRIAFGSYNVDMQQTSTDDARSNMVVVSPQKYAVPFRSIVPHNLEGILVVSRSASYDPLAHGSARIIPTGMAVAESAGVAVKLAQEHDIAFHEMAQKEPIIKELQDRINKQGMVVLPYNPYRAPYMNHAAYEGLKVAVSLGAVAESREGSTEKGFRLDEHSTAGHWIQVLEAARLKHGRDSHENSKEMMGHSVTTLTLEQACMIADKVLGIKNSHTLLSNETQTMIQDHKRLTNGETYMLLRDLLLALL